jgi:hypothetical protein
MRCSGAASACEATHSNRIALINDRRVRRGPVICVLLFIGVLSTMSRHHPRFAGGSKYSGSGIKLPK